MRRPTVRILLGTTLVVVLVAAGAVAWHLRERRQVVYTDADTIRRDLADAAPRDVLWQPPVALADAVNSGGDEYEPALSGDGRTLILVRGRAAGEADLYISTRLGDGWSTPQPLSALNTDADELGPEIAADGSRLYFCSDRGGGEGGYDIWCALRDGDDWSEPFNLGAAVNSDANEYGPAVSGDGTRLYFASNRPDADADPPNDTEADYDLYVASVTPDGIDAAVAVTVVNSPYHEGSPALSPFGDFLYFTSDRPGGNGGFDLYRSRQVDGLHRPPSNLGPPVNTAAHELDPTIVNGGFGLYFASDRARGPHQGTEADDAHYDLYLSMSREVFAEVSTYRARLDWGELWGIIAPVLIWLVILLLLLLAMIRLVRDARFARAGLLVRCLLGSVLVHALVLFLLTFWGVSSDLSKWLDDSQPLRVALQTSASSADLAGQVRAALTRFEVQATDAPTSARNLELEQPRPLTTATELPALAARVERTRVTDRDSVHDAELEPTEPDMSREAVAVRPSEASTLPPLEAARRARANEATASAEQAAAAPAPAPRRQERPDMPAPRPEEDWRLATSRTAVLEDGADQPSLSEMATSESMAALSTPQLNVPTPSPVAPDTPLPGLSEITTERTAEADVTIRATPDALPRRPSSFARGAAANEEAAPMLMAAPTTAVPDAGRLFSTTGRDSRPSEDEWSPPSAQPVGSMVARVDLPDLPQTQPRPDSEATAVVTARRVVAQARRPLESLARGERSDAVEPVRRDVARAESDRMPLADVLAVDSPAPVAADGSPVDQPLLVSVTQPRQTDMDLPTAETTVRVVMAERATAVDDDLAAVAPTGRTAIETAPDDVATDADLQILATTTARSGLEAAPLADIDAADLTDASRPAPAVPDLVVGDVAPASADVSVPALADAASDRKVEGALAVRSPVAPTSAVRAPLAMGGGTDAPDAPGLAVDSAGVAAARFEVPIRDIPHAASGRKSSPGGQPRAPLMASSATATGTLDLPDLPLAATGESAVPRESSRSTSMTAAAASPRWLGEASSERSWTAEASPDQAVPAAALGDGAQLATAAPTDVVLRTQSEATRRPAVPVAPAGSSLALPESMPLPSEVAMAAESPASAPAEHPRTRRAQRLPLAALSSDANREEPMASPAPVTAEPAREAVESRSFASAMAEPRDAAPPRTEREPWLLASRARAVPDPMDLDLDLPMQAAPMVKAYEQRTEEGRIELVEALGGSEETEEAVALALEWLAAHQSRDGRWDGIRFDDRCRECDGEARVDVDIALTGLSVLCFLAADHTHTREGPHQETVRRAIDWLVEQQGRRGDLLAGETMYSHGIASIALAEAYGMTRDADLAEPVRAAADFIFEARNRTIGGWRYGPGQIGDTSVLGWQVMALTSARRAGIEVPEEAFEVARRWLWLVDDPTRPGLYAYKPDRAPTAAMTAEATFVRQLLGESIEDDEVDRVAAYLMENRPDWESDANTYYWYYATLALFQQQGDWWDQWNAAVMGELLAHQHRDGTRAGSWDPGGQWANVGGRVYQTAMCTLTLEVYYRYLPLYLQAPPGGGITKRDAD